MLELRVVLVAEEDLKVILETKVIPVFRLILASRAILATAIPEFKAIVE
jgi:hypothetical protein